ncbi:MAG: hypothetical protein RR092_03310 [Oscillospiraceae bacterium]
MEEKMRLRDFPAIGSQDIILSKWTQNGKTSAKFILQRGGGIRAKDKIRGFLKKAWQKLL